MKRYYYFSKKILASSIIAGIIPVTAALADGFGSLTNSSIRHTAEVLSTGSRSVAAYLTAAEEVVKSTNDNGTGILAPGIVTIGLDSGAMLTSTFAVTAPVVILTITASTGSMLRSGDSAVFTGASGPGGVTSWTCILKSPSTPIRSIEVLGPRIEQVVKATVAMSSGIFSSCAPGE
jgi:hypothetical protein